MCKPLKIIKRKNQKRIVCRVQEAKVIVSAPTMVSNQQIQDFLLIHKDWILQQLQKQPMIHHGDYFELFDISYQFDTNSLIPSGIYDHRVVAHTSLELKQILYDHFQKICQSRFNCIAHSLGFDNCDLQIKEYKSRWGSCKPKDKLITININLIFSNILCLDAVLYHEFAHLVVSDHSKKFYQILLTWCPDYRQIHAQLKNIVIPQFQF